MDKTERSKIMAVKLSKTAFNYAKELVSEQKVVTTKGTPGANTNLRHEKRMNSSACTASMNTESGI